MAENEDGLIDPSDAKKILGGVVDKKSGAILGGLITLPPSLRLLYEAVEPRIMSAITKVGEKPVADAVTAAATMMKVDKVRAEKIGLVAGRTAAYATPFLPDMGNIYQTAKFHRANKKMVLEELAPLLMANKAVDSKGGVVGNITGLFANGYSDNKMIARALRVVTEDTYRNLGRDATGAIPRAFNTYGTYLDGQFKDAGKAADKAFDEGNEAGVLKHKTVQQELAKRYKNVNDFGTNLSGVAQQAVVQYLDGETPAETIGKMSLGTILRLKDYLRENEIDDVRKRANLSERERQDAISTATQLVTQAFQQFQKEEHRHAIPSHSLQEAAHTIASELVLGDMHALSLVNIIGKDLLLDDKKTKLLSPEKIQSVIKNQSTILSKSSAMNVDEFMADLNYTLDDVKALVQSKDADERALVVMLHPKKVLKAAGMKDADIAEAQKHISGRVMERTFGSLIDEIAKRSDAELMEKGESEDAIIAIRNLAGNPEALARTLKSAAGTEEIKSIVSAAVMGEEPGKWGALIRNSRTGMQEVPTPSLEGGSRKPLDYTARNGASADFSKN